MLARRPPFKGIIIHKFKRRPIGCDMTVCAGFLCTNGLILGADTEFSGGAKYHAIKLRRAKFPAGEYILTGTGNSGFIGMAADFIWGALDQAEAKFKKVKSADRKAVVFSYAVDTVIKAIHTAYIQQPTYPDQIPYLELILGVHFQGEDEQTRLMHCAGDGSVHWIDHHIAAGMGADIALRFLTILSPGPCPMDVMTSIAFLCLAQAKLSAEGVGGNTDLMKLPHPPKPIVQAWYSDSPMVELAEDALRLAICAPREMNQEQLDSALRKFSDKVLKVKQAVDQSVHSEKVTLELLRRIKNNEPIMPFRVP
jgi:hypothetical protein